MFEYIEVDTVQVKLQFYAFPSLVCELLGLVQSSCV